MGTHGGYTMGSRVVYHGCPMGRIPKPPGPQGTLGPLGPLGLIGPQGLMAPQGTQGSGSMAWMRRSEWLRPANRAPARTDRVGVGGPQGTIGPLGPQGLMAPQGTQVSGSMA